MECRLFNPNVDYDNILAKLGEKFMQRWEKDSPSPHTNLESYEELNVLGAGAFGKVVLVRHKESGKSYACKIMSKESIIKSKSLKHLYAEKRVLQSVCFPFLINLEFSTKDNDYVYMGLPLIQGGDLFSLLKRQRKFSEKNARFYACQVLLGLEYLHYSQIIYRDLKPENIMIDHSNGYLKIVDFGFAKKVKNRAYTFCGTPEYLAPEVIKMQPYGFGVDWWAFGVLLFELTDGRTPFIGDVNSEIGLYARICDGKYRLPPSFSPQFQDLIRRLLVVKSAKRLGSLLGGAKGIKNHEWFRGVNWYALLNLEVGAPYSPAVYKGYSPDPKARLRLYNQSKVDRYTDEFAFF